MIDCAIEDRGMIVQAVLDGVLSADFITEEELFELEDAVFEAVCDKYTPFAIWEPNNNLLCKELSCIINL